MSLALKNRSAHIRYLLWLIVLAKCLAPPLVTIPLAILPQESLVEPVPILPAELPAATIERVNTAITEPPIPISAPVVKERAVRLTVHQWLGFGWVVGVAIFAVFGVIKAWRTNLWLCRQRKPLPAKLRSGIEDLFSGFDLKTLPKIWLLEGISQPFVWGLLRGSIYLPADFVKVDNAEHRKGVLGHELSHILRFDAAVNLLQVMAQAIFWFHPFVWWANKKIRGEREKCCDEMAIARLGAKARDYSSAIVNILISEHESTRPVPSLAVAGPVKNIEERIKTMLRPGKKFYKRPSLIAAIVVLLVAVLIVPTTLVPTARAQTRPSRPTRTVKTKVGRTAAIEQLASATIIKGRILDLKNEPAYLAHVVALPVTSYGTQIVLGNKEGYFELPWSPTWIDQGQAVCLLAKGHYGRNESVFFEVNDPALPVTIHLEPAVTITGKVIDPNGQPMRSTIILSLARPFRCRAPISADTTITADIDKSQEGKFTLSMLPYNQTYNLNIQAEGYRSTELTVDTRDTSKDNMDIGTITLQPQDPTKPVVAERSPNPDLMKEFYEIYRLEEGEVIKLIKPPFVLGRQEYLNTKQKVTSSAGLNAGGDFKIVFDWDGKLKLRAGFTGASRLNKVPALILGIPDYDFKLPKELDVRLPEGDWIVRNV
jgi:beta-lactamase regulating signal transducer with metallopeptidase domain